MAGTAILIAGASGSGKTTLAERVAESLDAVLLRTDDYYRPLDHLTYEDRCEVNFDAPESVDGALLCQHTHELLQGRAIERPIYDFHRHTRDGSVTVRPRRGVVVEGIFAHSYPTLSRQRTLSVFVDTSEAVCLERRVRRDVEERGRTAAEVIWRFRTHVYPMFLLHVAPQRECSDLVVSGEDADGYERVMDRLGALGL